jgi:hypothetical protein
MSNSVQFIQRKESKRGGRRGCQRARATFAETHRAEVENTDVRQRAAEARTVRE